MKIVWHNSKNIQEAEVAVIGVPDESGSHARRKGSSRGPDAIRKISRRRFVYVHNREESVEQAGAGLIKAKARVRKVVENVVKARKIPIVLGGDHSITFEVLKGINAVKKDVSVVYFDAHPDFICSSHFYHGSVMCDASRLKHVNLQTSLEIGIRAPEKEELINIKKRKFKTLSAYDVLDLGVKEVFEIIKKRVGKNVYLSIYLDAVDPAFAPGVNDPAPGGLTSNELLALSR